MEEEQKSDLLDALEIRERKYIEGRLSGKSKMQAALDAGYTESMAANATVKIESRDVRRAFRIWRGKRSPRKRSWRDCARVWMQ